MAMKKDEHEAPFLGALIDDRPEAEKEKDYLFSEIVMTPDPVDWTEKVYTRRFPIFDQDGSGSCVAQTVAKMAGVMYAEKNAGDYVHFSATHVYQRRMNRPRPGMIGIDAMNIARDSITLEELVPSQRMTDEQMDGVEIPDYKDRVGEIFKFGNYVTVAPRDIDTIASIIQRTGKAVMVWFYFRSSEWKRAMPEVKYPDLDLYASTTARHSVTAVDFTLLPNGKKALIIEDSWGTDTGIEGQRIIDEDFFKARNYFACYALNFDFENPYDGKPGGHFEKTLEWSPTVTYDEDVVDLQNILKYEGMFPANVQSSGYYGSITAKAVLEWQLKFMKDYPGAPDSLIELKGRIVGPATRARLNEMY